MESSISNLDSLDVEIEKKSKMIAEQNYFILKLINEIGNMFDKEFIEIEEFDLDANINDFNALFDYFYSLCEDKPNKSMALHLISYITLQMPCFNENYANLINDIKEILINDDIFTKKDKKKKLIEKLFNDLCSCVSEEEKIYLNKFQKMFGLDFLTLYNLLLVFFSDEINMDTLEFTLEKLTEKYKKLLISDSAFDPALTNNKDFFKYLNKFLETQFENSSKVIVFEKSELFVREMNIEEYEEFINNNPKKLVNYTQEKLRAKMFSKVDIPPKKEIGSSKLTPIDSKEIHSEFTITAKNEDEKKKVNEVVNDLNKMKQENLKLRFQISNMDKDLKQIKMRSLFKGIIDIFTKVFKIKIDDSYKNKLDAILKCLNRHQNTKTISEFKKFLIDIYSYLKSGNNMANNIDTKATPLELLFSFLKKDKKHYPQTKNLLEKLSLNQPLKFAMNNYYSVEDRDELLKNTNITSEEILKLI